MSSMHRLIVLLVFVWNHLVAPCIAIAIAYALIVWWVSQELATCISWSMCTLWVLASVYLCTSRPFHSRLVAIVDARVMFTSYTVKLPQAWILLLLNISKIFIWFKGALAFRRATHEVLLHHVSIRTWHPWSINIQLCCLLSLLFANFLTIDLGQLWKQVDDKRSV